MLTRLITARHSAIALLLCSVLASMPVAARGYSYGHGRSDHARSYLARNDRGESLDSAVSRIRGSTGGRVLSAETRNENGQNVHYIRVLTRNGKVKRIRVEGR
jgi:hypothetical protein